MSWNRRPTELIIQVEGQIVERRREMALLALRGLVLRSPVDTGRFRGSWNVTYASVGNYDAGPLGGESAATTSAFSRGTSAIARGNNRPYDTMFISNNIPYAAVLNYGTNRRQGLMMLEIVFNDIRVRFG